MRQITLAEFEALQQKYAEAEAGESPPQVEEHLSGMAQQLAATPNAVAYKNFTGDHIEETTLLKDGLNQILNTNITETYAPGVTSTLNETAPSINQQVTLTDSHTLNVKNRSETVYSKNETQNINVTDWKVYHKNLTQNIPTKLTHQVTKSSQVTIDQYEGHIDVQRINADTYTHNFGTQTFNGPMQIHSSSSIAIRGNNIIFGLDTSALSDSIRSCNPMPTPAPKNILGTCQYYTWRNNDFIDRHVNCQHDRHPPDYYLQYGLVFCRLFSTELSKKMDAYGRGWIDRTRLNLQTNMETFLKANPSIELNNHSFYEMAFHSHQAAYLNAGFLNLSGRDAVQFLDVMDFARTLVQVDYVGHLARTQTIELMNMYLEAHKKDEYGLYLLAAAKEGAYLLDTWRHSLFEELNASL